MHGRFDFLNRTQHVRFAIGSAELTEQGRLQ